MKVVTINPIFIDRRKVSSKDKYLSANGLGLPAFTVQNTASQNAFNQSQAPIPSNQDTIINTTPIAQPAPNAVGLPAFNSSTELSKPSASQGKFKKLFGGVKGLLQNSGAGSNQPQQQQAAPLNIPQPEQQGMSKNLKIGLAVGGGVAVLAVVLILVLKKK